MTQLRVIDCGPDVQLDLPMALPWTAAEARAILDEIERRLQAAQDAKVAALAAGLEG